MSTSVELARQHWEDGHRRVRAHASEPDHSRLLDEVEAVTEELRRRIGGTYTLAELAEVYRGAESWLHETVARREAGPGWPRRVGVAGDEAFHRYSRGAQDYSP
jgi:hypothetical protein